MKMYKKFFFILCFFVLIVFGFILCANKKNELSGFSMNAPYSIRINAYNEKNGKKTKEIIKKCDRLFDAYNEDSELYKLNKDKRLYCTDDNEYIFDIIKKSYPYCNDFFDISIRNISRLWDFNSDNPDIPDGAEIKEALETVGYENIVVSDNEIFLKNNCSIELGAVAKGYCADKVFEVLKGDGAVIDIGGTVISGIKGDINVGIKNPDGEGILGTFKMKYGDAVSTSGSYERYFYKNNIKYHHILDPKTGICTDNNLISVTVVSDSALKSDILSTTYFVEGFNEKKSYGDNVTAIFVTKDKKVYIKGNNNVLLDLNNEYTFAN